MGTIKVKNIRVYAYHGCLIEEGKIGSDYRVDLSVKANLKKSSQTDELADTIDYVHLNRIVKEDDTRKLTTTDISVINSDEGYIDEILDTFTNDGMRIVKIRMRMSRIPEIGDKFASNTAQKGTCGMIYSQEDMPFNSDGITPDLIMNPHSIPSRMTVAQLIECVSSKIAAITGEFIDGTPFNNYDVRDLPEILKKLGYKPHGTETMYCGITGKKMEAEIFIGPTYYMRLKHMVADKINYRARGPNTAMTRQAVQGRANDGGLRIGEMERDGVLGHGATHFLNESLLDRGDDYYMAVCNNSGGIAIYNEQRNIFDVSAECRRDNEAFPMVGRPVECLIESRIRVPEAYGYWPVRSYRASEEVAQAQQALYRALGGRRV